MSLLEFYGRPLVAFDPSNKEHRKHWFNFLTHGGWGSCPVRFIVPDSNGQDLVTMIQHNLVQYYVDREFHATPPKTTPGRWTPKPKKY